MGRSEAATTRHVSLLFLGTSKRLFVLVVGRFYRCQFSDLTAIAPGVL